VDVASALDASTGILVAAHKADLTNIPVSDPVNEKQLDYMLYQWCPVAMAMSEVVGVGATAGDRIYAFDVSTKSSRKCEEIGDSIWFTWAMTGAINAEAISAEWSVPCLLP